MSVLSSKVLLFVCVIRGVGSVEDEEEGEGESRYVQYRCVHINSG